MKFVQNANANTTSSENFYQTRIRDLDWKPMPIRKGIQRFLESEFSK